MALTSAGLLLFLSTSLLRWLNALFFCLASSCDHHPFHSGIMTSPPSQSPPIDPDVEEADPDIDFLNLSVRLNRPSDHYRGLNPYEPPPRRKHLTPHQLAQKFLQDPVTTTLSSFSKVANFVWTPHEEYDNVLDVISSRTEGHKKEENSEPFKPPPPALPLIVSSTPQFRQDPLPSSYFDDATEKKDIEEVLLRVFRGGIAENELRRRLWPLVLGLSDNLDDCDWSERDRLFDHYQQQWLSILPDQEERFTAYRERKSILERDVVRCDRTHPFYSDQHENLEKLKILLMTYVMYDFDTGYVQGMTDLASPILFVWNGDIKRAFWCFVQVMKLFKNNFELSQKTISVQLEMLFKMIKLTDPCFAQYLAAHESDNCYFAFRWIICIFKREFMKGKTDDYHDCLLVWETIWAATALSKFRCKEPQVGNQATNSTNETTTSETIDLEEGKLIPDQATGKVQEATPASSNGSDSPKCPSDVRSRLTDSQLFVLCICLSIIRRERDLIMASDFDACETLKHFNTLNLNESLGNILLHATTIWSWLVNDGGLEQLYAAEIPPQDKRQDSTGEDFDLLNDEFMMISTMNV